MGKFIFPSGQVVLLAQDINKHWLISLELLYLAMFFNIKSLCFWYCSTVTLITNILQLYLNAIQVGDTSEWWLYCDVDCCWLTLKHALYFPVQLNGGFKELERSFYMVRREAWCVSTRFQLSWRPPFTARFGDSCVKQLELKESYWWHFTNI